MSESLILFFHPNSEPCKKLSQIIPKDKEIKLINIDEVQNIPPSIKSIPALVIDNKEVLTGKKVFDYFNKSDEMEYLNFGGKNSGSTFSSIDDNEINGVESNTLFSSIDADSISAGVPKWEETENKETIDIDKLQAERDTMFRGVERQ